MSRHEVMDGLFPETLVDRAVAEWPGEEAPWVIYNTPEQRKRTLGCSRLPGGVITSYWSAIPGACRALLERLLVLDPHDLLGLLGGRLVPDTLLWGAGLCTMGPGDRLARHLDADRHALTGMERRVNAVLFLTTCSGGDLLLGTTRVQPAPGRLVLFETTEESVHEVEPVTAGRRLSLAIYWFSRATKPGRRPQAQFL